MWRKPQSVLFSPALAYAAAAWMLLICPALALDPQKSITQFSHQTWGVADGIEQVYAIDQTSDGYLWLATDNGLFRFDGGAFTLWEPNPGEPALPGVPYHLLATKNGSLWIGGVGYLILLKDGHSKVFTLRNPEERARVAALCEGKDGTVWAGTSLGLYKFAADNWEKVGPERDLLEGAVTALMVDKEHTIWAVIENKKPDAEDAIVCLRAGETRFQLCGQVSHQSIVKLAQAPDGKIWAAAVMRSVRAFTYDQKKLQFVAPEIRVGSQSILIDRNGGLWISTLGDGLRRVRNTATLGDEDIERLSDAVDKFTQKDGLSSDYITCSFEDREGVVWFGTSAGLDCFRETKITPVSVREGLPFDQNLSVLATPDGSVWAASTPGGFIQFDGSHTRFINRNWLDLRGQVQGQLIVYSLHVDSNGDLIIGTGFGVVILRPQDQHGTLIQEVPDMKTVLAITRDPAGGLWLCDRYMGVYRLFNGKPQHFPELHREADGWVAAAFTDSEGRVWLGFTTGEVALYESGRFRIFSAQDGLFPGQITAVLSDQKRQIWAVGKGGISRYHNGRFQTLNRGNGLPFDNIFAGIQDNDGSFWLAGSIGIFRVDEKELEAALATKSGQITGELFDLSDGLRGMVRHIPYGNRGNGYSVATKGADGKLWFATTAGLAVVDPQSIPRNKLVPPVRIQQVIAGGKIYNSFGKLQLPAGIRDCEIRYAGLSYDNIGKVRYRYRLEGYESDWKEVGTRRQAFYSNLRPNTYRFQVSACNADGVWNEASDSMEFVVPSMLYETTWFHVLCGVLSSAALVGIYTWRVRRLKARQQELQKARDLLEASEHLARGQLEMLTGTLEAVSHESEPEKLLEHALKMIGRQLGADSMSVWEMNEGTGRAHLVANCEGGHLHLATQTEIQISPKLGLTTQYHPIWTEFFRTGTYSVIGEINPDGIRVRIADVPDSPWHEWTSEPVPPTIRMLVKRLHSSGSVATLAVPLFVAGKVTGLISSRFKEKRSFRPEELELTRALAHQAMLAIQLIRLSQQSRETAIVAERNRMARDIHDTLAQGFTGVIMQLEAAKGAASQGKPGEVADRIERAGELARSSLGEARRSVRALRPRQLQDGKLSLALQDLLRRMTDGSDLNADFKASGDEHAIPADVEEALLRITQEAITNTVRHANARNFSATLNLGPDKIQLQLVDDGRGFDSELEREGFGLIGMKERVDQLGGQFILRSKPGIGTEILVVLKANQKSKTENGSE